MPAVEVRPTGPYHVVFGSPGGKLTRNFGTSILVTFYVQFTAAIVILQFSVLGLWVTPNLAQHEDHEGNNVVGWVPREILDRPLALRQNIGNLHQKVTTTSPEAQAFYDQGLNY